MRSTLKRAVALVLMPLGFALIVLIKIYQYMLSPLMPPTCRYLPTCSAYAAEAVQRHGAIVGAWLALRRLARCHPWGGHGYDPVPKKCASNHAAQDRRPAMTSGERA
jgi:putative membrane protein insertion efficiency factor